jgi:competence ComEA-like helix-hairpin-helix protein
LCQAPFLIRPIGGPASLAGQNLSGMVVLLLIQKNERSVIPTFVSRFFGISLFKLTRQEQIVVLLLIAGLFTGSAVLIIRGRPEPPAGEPLNFAVELPKPTTGSSVGTRASKIEKERGEKIDINVATPEELVSLPGIGPVLAGRIVEYREDIGRFTTPSEIIEVKGIGEGKYRMIEEYITVD